MTHDQVCAIKAVQSAVASARKVGVTDAEIRVAIAVGEKVAVSFGAPGKKLWKNLGRSSKAVVKFGRVVI
jgi:hypothetical protein